MNTEQPNNSTNQDPDQHPHLPEDQQARAANAHPNANDPMVNAAAPNYGEFGGGTPTTPASGVTSYAPSNSAAPRSNNDGSNDNPDEFSEFRKGNKTGSEDYSPEAGQANPAAQKGHVEQNQNPAAVRDAQNEDNDVQRTAWADDDPRYAGGGTHNEAFNEKPA
jgi:hypothetical protein